MNVLGRQVQVLVRCRQPDHCQGGCQVAVQGCWCQHSPWCRRCWCALHLRPDAGPHVRQEVQISDSPQESGFSSFQDWLQDDKRNDLHAARIAERRKEDECIVTLQEWFGREGGSMKLCVAFPQKSAEHVPLFRPGQPSDCITIGSVLKAYRFLSVSPISSSRVPFHVINLLTRHIPYLAVPYSFPEAVNNHRSFRGTATATSRFEPITALQSSKPFKQLDPARARGQSQNATSSSPHWLVQNKDYRHRAFS